MDLDETMELFTAVTGRDPAYGEGMSLLRFAEAVAAAERAELVAIMKAHLTEPQIVIVTSIYDRPKDVAIKECIGIIELRSNASAKGPGGSLPGPA